MTILRFSIFYFLLLTYTLELNAQKKTENLKIFYIPFEFETYFPITQNNIENESYCVFNIEKKHQQEIKKLTSFNPKPSTGKFDEKIVRVKIKSELGNNVFIDRNGSIFDGEKSYSLDSTTLNQLSFFLNQLGYNNKSMCEIPIHLFNEDHLTLAQNNKSVKTVFMSKPYQLDGYAEINFLEYKRIKKCESPVLAVHRLEGKYHKPLNIKVFNNKPVTMWLKPGKRAIEYGCNAIDKDWKHKGCAYHVSAWNPIEKKYNFKAGQSYLISCDKNGDISIQPNELLAERDNKPKGIVGSWVLSSKQKAAVILKAKNHEAISPKYTVSYRYKFNKNDELITFSGNGHLNFLKKYSYKINNRIISAEFKPSDNKIEKNNLLNTKVNLNERLFDQKYKVTMLSEDKLILQPEGYAGNISLVREGFEKVEQIENDSN